MKLFYPRWFSGSATLVALSFLLWREIVAWQSAELRLQTLANSDLLLSTSPPPALATDPAFLLERANLLADVPARQLQELARQDYLGALVGDPLNARPWINLAEIDVRFGNSEDARRETALAQKLDSSYARLQLKALRLWSFLGEAEAQEETLDRLTQLDVQTLRAVTRFLRWPPRLLFDRLRVAEREEGDARLLMESIQQGRPTSVVRDVWDVLPPAWLNSLPMMQTLLSGATAAGDWAMVAALWRVGWRAKPLPNKPPETTALLDAGILREFDLSLEKHPISFSGPFGWRLPTTAGTTLNAQWIRPISLRDDKKAKSSGEWSIRFRHGQGAAWRWEMLRLPIPAGVPLTFRVDVTLDEFHCNSPVRLRFAEVGRSSDEARIPDDDRTGAIHTLELELPASESGGIATLELIMPGKDAKLDGGGTLVMRHFRLDAATSAND